MEQYISTSSWVKDRTRPILTIVTVIAVIGAAVLIYWWFTSSRQRAASESLGEAFKVSEAVVANPIPPVVTGYAFASEDEKARKTYEAFEKAARDYPSFHGDLARYYGAINQLRFDAPAAEVTLKDLSQKSGDIASQARMALAERYEATGKFDDAAKLYLELKAKPDGVPALMINFNLARTYEAQGKSKEAADLYFDVAKEGKSAGIGGLALARLSGIDPARLEQLPAPEPSSPLAGLR